MAEQQALLGLRKDECSDRFGLQHATADQSGPVCSKNRPHMNLSAGSFCATALSLSLSLSICSLSVQLCLPLCLSLSLSRPDVSEPPTPPPSVKVERD